MNVVKTHKKLVLFLFILVLGMFAFAFALVPIYNRLCQTLGINGKTNQKAVVFDEKNTKVETEREVLVEFVANKNPSLAWAFYPKTAKLRIHPGEKVALKFYAENQSAFTMSVQAIPSVTPGIAAKYLKKTECFCFTRQTLNGHEAMDMPLIFHLDKDLPKQIKTITLSYTLYDVTDKAAS